MRPNAQESFSLRKNSFHDIESEFLWGLVSLRWGCRPVAGGWPVLFTRTKSQRSGKLPCGQRWLDHEARTFLWLSFLRALTVYESTQESRGGAWSLAGSDGRACLGRQWEIVRDTAIIEENPGHFPRMPSTDQPWDQKIRHSDLKAS